MEIFNNILLCVSIILSLICVCLMFVYKDKKITGADKKIKDKKLFVWIGKSGNISELNIPDNVYRALLAAGAIVSVAVRVYQFGGVPGGFNQDGAMAAVDANALADYGTDRYGMRFPVHLTAWGFGQMSALLSYLMVPFIKLFGFSPAVLRLPQLIVSMAGLLCLYLFIKDAFGKNMGLFAFLFAAINPWHILQSRWALDCNLYPHFFIIGIYFLHKGINKKLHLILSMISFGLCMYCYGVSIYTMPLFLLMSCIYLLVTKRIKIKDAIIAAVTYLLVAWPFIMVMMVNFFKWDTIETPFFTIPYFEDSVRSNDILFFSENIAGQFVENIKALLGVTFLQKKDLPWNDIEGFGTMYLFSVPFVVLGIVSLFKRYRKNAGSALIIFYFLTGAFCGILTYKVNINRINIIYYPIIIFAGMGLYEASRWFAFSKWGLLAVYVLAFGMFANVYFTSYADEIRGYFHGDFGDALEAAADEDADRYYITRYSDYPGLTEILVQFHHQIDAEYYQGKTDNGELPYYEKYTIGGVEKWYMAPSENAVYVVGANELKYFDEDYYDIQQFGYYYMLVPVY